MAEAIKPEKSSSSGSSSSNSSSDDEPAAGEAGDEKVDKSSLFGWRIMEDVKARNVEFVPGAGTSQGFCDGDVRMAFEKVLLLDGFEPKIPTSVSEDFNKFAEAPSTVGNNRQKIVRDRCAQFGQVLFSKDWTGQDELILRKSLWASKIFDLHGKEFEAHLEDNLFVGDLGAAQKEQQRLLCSKMFKVRYTAVKGDFQNVGTLTYSQ